MFSFRSTSICLRYTRNTTLRGLQFFSGYLEKRKSLSLPGIAPQFLSHVTRCLVTVPKTGLIFNSRANFICRYLAWLFEKLTTYLKCPSPPPNAEQDKHRKGCGWEYINSCSTWERKEEIFLISPATKSLWKNLWSMDLFISVSWLFYLMLSVV